ncbi:MAG: YqgE/AlgH family protein [Pseudomonadota bacterium]
MTASPDAGSSLRHQLLIAMPQLDDPHFHHSVTYIFEHNTDGAMGIIVNRPIDAAMSELFEQLDINTVAGDLSAHRLLYGGPVQANRGFVLHRTDPQLPRWNHCVQFDTGITLATSRDVLEAIAGGTGPAGSIVALGYAGWGPGQLEHELGENAWLAAPVDPAILFDLPLEQRWSAAARSIGVDLGLISHQAGHA